MKAPTYNKIHDACCKYNKEDGGAMLVKWWYIPLWRMLHYAVTVFGKDDRVGLGGILNFEF